MTGPTGRRRALGALRTHLPDRGDVPLFELGRGLDHTAFLADDLVLRVGTGDSVAREAELLRVLARHVTTLAVPRPCFADRAAGVLAYPLIAGRPLLGTDSPAPGTARQLGGFLRELHAIDTATVAGLVPVEPADPNEWLECLDGPPELIDAIRADVPPPARRSVLAHADLGAEHLVEREGVLAGVIDWSDAAITDPALDFARPYRDFGPGFLADLIDAYGGLDDPQGTLARIRFFARCSALEDLAYGRATGAHEYTKAAGRSIRWLFGCDHHGR